mmetsp:Transcript_4528/g.8463  ORF Transcript_4528/g.8463 Transcript_4528/m.8463 type:complete len:231 (+) Transcript_4528:2565-3257(+)
MPAGGGFPCASPDPLQTVAFFVDLAAPSEPSTFLTLAPLPAGLALLGTSAAAAPVEVPRRIAFRVADAPCTLADGPTEMAAELVSRFCSCSAVGSPLADFPETPFPQSIVFLFLVDDARSSSTRASSTSCTSNCWLPLLSSPRFPAAAWSASAGVLCGTWLWLAVSPLLERSAGLSFSFVHTPCSRFGSVWEVVLTAAEPVAAVSPLGIVIIVAVPSEACGIFDVPVRGL